MTDHLPVPVEADRFSTPRVVATGRECWWRLGPNIRHRTRTASDRGVRGVADLGGGRCEIVMQTGHRVAVSCRAYRIMRKPGEITSVDVYSEWPPPLPDKTDWQQITARGDQTHPGDDMTKWRYENPWD